MLYNATITKQVTNQARVLLSIKKSLPEKGLKYIGFTDCSMLEPGWYQLNFNVTVPNKKIVINSTIIYNFGKTKEA